MEFHVVVRGRRPGIYRSWNEAKEQVHGFSGAVYKKFRSEKEAEEFYSPARPVIVATVPSCPLLPLIGRTIVFTDGSMQRGIGSGYGIVTLTPEAVLSKYYGKVPLPLEECSSQKAELYAVYAALHITQGALRIVTDSQYTIDCLTSWGPQWEKDGWEGVANSFLIRPCLGALKDRDVEFQHVRGHTGVWLNEETDRLAKMGCACNSSDPVEESSGPLG